MRARICAAIPRLERGSMERVDRPSAMSIVYRCYRTVELSASKAPDRAGEENDHAQTAAPGRHSAHRDDVVRGAGRGYSAPERQHLDRGGLPHERPAER